MTELDEREQPPDVDEVELPLGDHLLDGAWVDEDIAPWDDHAAMGAW